MSDPSEVEPELEKAVQIYRAFMEEIKTRLEIIGHVVAELGKSHTHKHAFVQAELGFLQLRTICELIALSALAAHQPYGLAEDLMESWNARHAFLALRKLNVNCFPRPITVNRSEAGIQIELTPKALTQKGLVRYYNKCGSALHRGIVRHAFEGTTKVYDIDALNRWATRIGQLLSYHTIMILDQGLVLLVNLTSGPDGSVSIAIAKGGPAILVESEDQKPRPRPGRKQPPPQ